MKITSDDLKKIIKESLKRLSLQEAPFAGIEPMLIGKEKYARSNPKTLGDSPHLEQEKIEKFYRSPSYEKKANWAFAGFNIPIYIIPYIEFKSLDSLKAHSIEFDQSRIAFLSREQFKKMVSRSKNEFNLEQIFSNLDSGASYIINTSNYLSKGFLPTPWMLFHAIFDNESFLMMNGLSNSKLFLPESLKTIYSLGFWIRDQLKYINNNYNLGKEIQKRTNLKNINDRTGISDVVAEIFTQEIATSAGFEIKMLGDEYDKLFINIFEKIKSLNLKNLMEETFKGQIILVGNAIGG